jgi:hypothetical protein
VGDCVARNDDGLDVGEEIVSCDGFGIRIVRPGPLAEEDASTRQPYAESAARTPRLEALPPLARPLPPRLATLPIAVTHLPDDGVAEEMAPQRPRPVVRLENGSATGGRPWRFLVGNLAHRALADWNCLALPEEAMRDRLEVWARRSGLSAPHDVREATRQVARLLRDLRAAPLYGEIASARERYSETPLSICAGTRMLHGVLDLLYLDEHGGWHLLDWKTERVARGQTLEEAAEGETIRQLAVYSHAVQQLLEIHAVAEVCFLSRSAEVYRPPAERLAEAWEGLVAEK